MASSPNNPSATGEPNDRSTATGGARSRVAGETDEPAAGRPANGQTVVVAVRPAADAAASADAGETGTNGTQAGRIEAVAAPDTTCACPSCGVAAKRETGNSLQCANCHAGFCFLCGTAFGDFEYSHYNECVGYNCVRCGGLRYAKLPPRSRRTWVLTWRAILYPFILILLPVTFALCLALFGTLLALEIVCCPCIAYFSRDVKFHVSLTFLVPTAMFFLHLNALGIDTPAVL